jgi:1,4-alpha-glucan branching enzyme
MVAERNGVSAMPTRSVRYWAKMDVYLFNEGTHYDIHKKLGAHVKMINDLPGVHFAVWAPTAQRVSVVGDFNNWDGRVHQMRKLLPSGVWEIFLPGVHEGSHYKFEIRSEHGDVFKNRSLRIFCAAWQGNGLHGFRFGAIPVERRGVDGRRSQVGTYNSPMSIYEVHIGSWQKIP